MPDYQIMANANRCTVFPQHHMVNQGHSELHAADVWLCECGEWQLGLTDEFRYRTGCRCRDSNNEGPIRQQEPGGLHYTYCPMYTLTKEEELATHIGIVTETFPDGSFTTEEVH